MRSNRSIFRKEIKKRFDYLNGIIDEKEESNQRDLREHWQKLDRNTREEADLLELMLKNRYHPDDCRDLCPFFSM